MAGMRGLPVCVSAGPQPFVAIDKIGIGPEFIIHYRESKFVAGKQGESVTHHGRRE